MNMRLEHETKSVMFLEHVCRETESQKIVYLTTKTFLMNFSCKNRSRIHVNTCKNTGLCSGTEAKPLTFNISIVRNRSLNCVLQMYKRTNLTDELLHVIIFCFQEDQTDFYEAVSDTDLDDSQVVDWTSDFDFDDPAFDIGKFPYKAAVPHALQANTMDTFGNFY